MDQFLIAILPKVIVVEIFEFAFEPILIDRQIISAHTYVVNTFARNIDYIENKHPLRYITKKPKTHRIVESRAYDLISSAMLSVHQAK